MRETSGRKKPVAAVIALLLTAIICTPVALPAQDAGDVLPPPVTGLEAVHHPDLTGLEKEVGEQINGLQDALRAEAAKASPAAAERLGRAYAALGRVYHAYSFYETAEECYRNASLLLPKDFRWPYLLGRAAAARNKISEAIGHYQRARQLNPRYLPVHTALGDAYLELNLSAIARESFENALKIKKDEPAALYGLGQILYAQRNYAAAARLFEKVLERVPEAGRVHYSLALAYRGLKDIEKAKFHLARQGPVGVRAADPLVEELDDLKRGARLRLLAGKLAVEAGRYREAAAEFEKALRAEPDNVAALVNYGVALVRLKRYPEAAESFARALRAEPENQNALYNLAVLLSMEKKHLPAIERLRRLLEIRPEDRAARLLLAGELRRAGLNGEALGEYRRLFAAEPDDEEILLELVGLHTAVGDHRRALELLEQSHRRFPTRGRTMAAYAYLLAASPQTDLRDGPKALDLARRIYAATGRAEHGAILALALAELGRCREAAQLTRELIEKNSDPGLSAKLIAELKRYQNEKNCRR